MQPNTPAIDAVSPRSPSSPRGQASVRIRIKPRINWFIVWSCLFLSNAFQRIIGQEHFVRLPSGGFIKESNNFVFFIGLATFSLAFGLIMHKIGRFRFHWSMLFTLALVLVCLASSAWSADQKRTVTQSLILIGVLFCVYYAYFNVNKSDLFKSLYVYAAIYTLTTFILALTWPSFAFHQAGEFFGMHAGRLRGLSSHKNDLAKYLSICLFILMYFGSTGITKPWIRYGLVALCAGLLMLTGSAKAVGALPVAILGSFLWTRTHLPSLRLLSIIVISWAWIFLSSTGTIEEIMAAVLQLLGRDPTLSSRTLIWSAVLEGLQNSPNWWLGGGYGAGWTNGVSDMVRGRLGSDTGHPHNGFIEVLIDIGIPGLIITIGLIFLTFLRALTSRLSGNDGRITFSVAVIFLTILSNMVGSYMFAAGDVMTYTIFLVPLLLEWKDDRRF